MNPSVVSTGLLCQFVYGYEAKSGTPSSGTGKHQLYVGPSGLKHSAPMARSSAKDGSPNPAVKYRMSHHSPYGTSKKS